MDETINAALREGWPSFLRKDFAVVMKLAMSSNTILEAHEFDDDYTFALDMARYVRDHYRLAFTDREVELAAFEYWKPTNVQ